MIHLFLTSSPMRYAFLILGTTTALASCAQVQETFDLSKEAPDEFRVVKRAPLSLPPNYNLRPPRPGAPRPQEQEPIEEARTAVFGGETAEAAAPIPDDAATALLQQAGGNQADPSIRDKLDSEISIQASDNIPVAKRILGIGSNEQSASVVDAKEEAERLFRNAAEGRPVTEGETPTIDQ